MVTQLRPGDPARIGRYRLLGQLGAGGMGRVLLGVGPDGRLVAIKQVHAHLITEEDFLPRFRREVQTSARVSGAFTAAVIDFDIESETPWLASVFVPGVPLDKAVHDFGPLPSEQVRTLAVGLASALHAIHGVGLIHRDLKPANVILDQDGPRVIDFGIARAAEGRSELTHTGSIIGSPAFMSPEQAQSEPLTPASDIFSLGTVLAMASHGKSPFAGSSMPHTLYNIVHTVPDLSPLPPEVRQLVEPCLRKDPAGRPTPAAILDFLGPLPTQRQPWSAAIHGAIHRQSEELSALRSDPEATQIIGADETTVSSENELTFDEKLRQLSADYRSASSQSRRKRVLIGAFAMVLILAGGAIAGAVTLTGGDDSSTGPVRNPLAGLNLTKVRSIDVCAAMQEQLVDSLGKWEMPRTAEWGGCSAAARGYRLLLKIERLEGFRDTGRTNDGVPVLENVSIPERSCDRALSLGTTDPQFGLTVLVGAPDQPIEKRCAIANEATAQLSRVLVAGLPVVADFKKSLARLDPCSLVPPTSIKLNVGPEVQGKVDDLYSCRWAGPNQLTVTLEQSSPRSDKDKPIHIEIGGGKVVDVDADELKSSECTRKYEYRSIDSVKSEFAVVKIRSSNSDRPEAKCIAAQDVLNSVVLSLPPVAK
ncbi:serine/threonine-protein kinase [Nocardia sp. CA-084685]|uniref:serine/threonine-protein kinase n=1 Tax=Nocardia sp. CA-084685 TaxID=3239970 RepID=UPI003D988A33